MYPLGPIPDREPDPDPTRTFGSAARQVPIATIRDNVYVLTDGRLAAGFKLRPLEYQSVEDSQIEQWGVGLRSVLNAGVDGLTTRMILRNHHNYRDVLDDFEQNTKFGSPLAKFLAKDELAGWRHEMETKQLTRSDVLVFYIYKPPKDLASVLDGNLVKNLLALAQPQGGTKAYQRTLAAHRYALDQMERAIAPCVTSLRILGLNPLRMTDEDLKVLAYEVLNPKRAMHEPPPHVRDYSSDPMYGRFSTGPGQQVLRTHPAAKSFTPLSLREQLTFSDMAVKDSFVDIDGVYHGVIRMRVLPDSVNEGMVLHLLRLGFAMSITLDAKMLNKSKEQKQLWNSVKMGESAAKATILPNSTPDPAELERVAEAREKYLQMARAGENYFMVRLLVVVQADRSAELDERCSAVLGAMRRMNNMAGVRERWAVDTLLKASWPFGLPITRNMRKLSTSETATLMPVYGMWPGNRRAIALFRTPNGRLVKYDPHNPDTTAKNKVIIGKTGRGKSVTAINTVVIPMLARNSEIFVVDAGASFEPLSMSANGAFLLLGPQSREQYNMFEIPPAYFNLPEKDQDEVRMFKASSITDTVLVMAGVTDPRAKRRAFGVIMEMVQEMIEATLASLQSRPPEDAEAWSKRMPLLNQLHRKLETYSNPQDKDAEKVIHEIATDLRIYVHQANGIKGNYAGVFDVHTSFNPQGQLIVLDFGKVKDQPNLFDPLAIIMITGLIYSRMLNFNGKEKVIILDEAWALLEKPASRDPIIRFYREGRKFNARTMLLSQNWSDVVNHPDADALIGNRPEKLFLGHEATPGNLKAFADSNINDVKAQQIIDLRQERGKFSELMLNSGNDWSVVRQELTPFRYWLRTTHGSDKTVRNQYLEIYHKHYGLTWAQVHFILAHDYPLGADARKDAPKLSEHAALSLATRFQLELDGLGRAA